MYQRFARLLIPRRSTAWAGKATAAPTVASSAGSCASTGSTPPPASTDHASSAPTRHGAPPDPDRPTGAERRYVAVRTDITLKSREGYEWAIPHIEPASAPSPCPASTARTSGATARRLELFHAETEPVLDFHRRRGLLATVDGTAPPDGVTAAIVQALDVRRQLHSLER
jgi:hypothetical protein